MIGNETVRLETERPQGGERKSGARAPGGLASGRGWWVQAGSASPQDQVPPRCSPGAPARGPSRRCGAPPASGAAPSAAASAARIEVCGLCQGCCWGRFHILSCGEAAGGPRACLPKAENIPPPMPEAPDCGPRQWSPHGLSEASLCSPRVPPPSSPSGSASPRSADSSCAGRRRARRSRLELGMLSGSCLRQGKSGADRSPPSPGPAGCPGWRRRHWGRAGGQQSQGLAFPSSQASPGTPWGPGFWARPAHLDAKAWSAEGAGSLGWREPSVHGDHLSLPGRARLTPVCPHPHSASPPNSGPPAPLCPPPPPAPERELQEGGEGRPSSVHCSGLAALHTVGAAYGFAE